MYLRREVGEAAGGASWAPVLSVMVSRGQPARRQPTLPLLVPGGALSPDRDVTVER